MKNAHPAHRNAFKAALALCLGLTGVAHAAPPSPGTVQQQVTPPAALPEAPAPVLNLPAPGKRTGKSSVRIPVKQVVITGNTLIPTADLLPLVQDIENKTVTLGDLQQAASRITDRYHTQGYPLAYAYLPAQKIKDGKLTIAVVEPRYDRISIDDASRLNTVQAQRTLGLSAGEPIEQAPLERGLLLLNQTPGIRVAGTLVPGAKPATSTLDARLSDTPMLRLSAMVDNYGDRSTGRTRGLVSASLDNPFGYGSQIAVNGLTTSGGLLHAGGFNLLSPNLYDGLRASAYGSRTDYKLGGAFADLGQSGQATQLGLALNYPLLLKPGRILNARLDWQRNRFKQTSTVVGLDDRSHVDLVRLTLNGAIADRLRGMTAGGISLTRGRLSLDSNDARMADAMGPHAAGAFWVGQLHVRRNQPLPGNFRLQAGLSAQIASHNLDDSQKFYLGGPYGVMSYPVSSGAGDSGALLRLKLSHDLPLPLPGRLEAAVLGQYGEIWLNHSPYAGAIEPNRQHMGGAGVGLSYRWSTHLIARLYYIHRVGSKPASVTTDNKQMLWASLRLDL